MDINVNSFASKKVYRQFDKDDLKKTSEDSDVRCPSCDSIILYGELSRNLMCCPQCGYYFHMTANQRIHSLLDEGTFEPIYEKNNRANPLNFPNYAKKMNHDTTTFQTDEAILTGTGKMNDVSINIGVFDTNFRMGSMGEVVGGRIFNICLDSLHKNKPLVLVTASGGARMQEGIFSLLQMAKTVAGIDMLQQKGIPVIIVLTDPTMGGVLASFATIGDILIGEPHARIGFAGKRVVKSTLSSSDKVDVQTSEQQYKYGHLDAIVPRKNLKQFLSEIIKFDGYEYKDCIAASKNENITRDLTVNNSINYEKILNQVRDVRRPTTKEILAEVFTNLIELHGDRINYDDKSLYTALGYIDNIPVTVIAQLHSNDLEENIEENYGMVRPSGYRKVIRQLKLAEKFNHPVIMFVDTKGADPLPSSEIENQASSISHSIQTSLSLKVPIITIILGEGGSGGALALGIADRVNIMSNAIYSVISPEGAAEILWHDKSKNIEAMKSLKITASELYELGLVDNIIPNSNSEGNYCGLELQSLSIKNTIINELKELSVETDLVSRRFEKYTRNLEEVTNE